jgi:hypothetical protein
MIALLRTGSPGYLCKIKSGESRYRRSLLFNWTIVEAGVKQERG